MRILLFTAFLLLLTLPVQAAKEKENAFNRVMRTGVLRCGYYVFPPITMRDPKTDELTGFSVDMMNDIAAKAGLKVEWTEEVTFGNWVPAMQARRFDAVCTPMWPDIPMARAVSFTDPLFFAGLYPLVRADDARFIDAGLARFNQPDVTFLAQDGNTIEPLTRAAFPQAQIHVVAGSVDGPTALQEIVTGKADAILLDRNGEIEYNRNNPVKLRLVTREGPVKAQAFALVVGRDELVLKDWFDNAIAELHHDGGMERLLQKWETEPGLFLRVAPTYQAP